MGVKLTPINQTSLALSWDVASAEDAWGYEVMCQQVGASGTVRKFQLASNSSGVHLSELKPRHKYQCRVRTTSSGTDLPCPSVSAWTLSDRKHDIMYLYRQLYIDYLDTSWTDISKSPLKALIMSLIHPNQFISTVLFTLFKSNFTENHEVNASLCTV